MTEDTGTTQESAHRESQEESLRAISPAIPNPNLEVKHLSLW